MKNDNDILVGLDDVDWSNLHPTYGKTMPSLLRSLASNNEYARSLAFSEFEAMHEWTICEISIEAIPFLVQLLKKKADNYSYVIEVLEDICFGGMYSEPLKEKTQIKLQIVLPILLEYINHSDENLRLKAIEFLSLYSHELALVVPLLQRIIETDVNLQMRVAAFTSLKGLWTGIWINDKKRLTNSNEMYFAKLMRDDSQMLPIRFEAGLVLIADKPELWLEEATTLFYELMNTHRSTLKNFWGLRISGIFHRIFVALIDYLELNLKWVINQASHPKREVREQVAYTLESFLRLGAPFDVMLPTLKQLMRDASPDVRKAAIMFFIQSPHLEAVRDILEDIAKNDIQSSIRNLALNALTGDTEV